MSSVGEFEYEFEVQDIVSDDERSIEGGIRSSAAPYSCLTPEQVYMHVYGMANELVPMTCLPVPSLVQILMACKLDRSAAELTLFGANTAKRDEMNKKHHICCEANAGRSDGIVANGQEEKCGICFAKIGKGEGFSTCGDHFICHDCMCEFLQVVTKIWEPRFVVLQCLVDHTRCLKAADFLNSIREVAPERIPSLNVDSFAAQFLTRFVSQVVAILSGGFVDRAVPCTETDCPNTFMFACTILTDSDIVAGQCSGCDSTSCFLCNNVGHQPVSCEEMKVWVEGLEVCDAAVGQTADGSREVGHLGPDADNDDALPRPPRGTLDHLDEETANWILMNTKMCPGCKNPIEKNGGCNHMTCSKCNCKFCWVCTGDLLRHGIFHDCNKVRMDAKDPKRSVAEKAASHKIHYYGRYMNHRRSRELEKATIKRVHTLIDTSARAAAMDYLVDAVKTLAEARHTLSITYINAFFHGEDINLPLFEYNQGQLEFATEQLSAIVEDKWGMMSDRRAVNNRTGLARHWLTVLQRGDYSHIEDKTSN